MAFDSSGKLSGKVALVTGAGHGIGAAIAKRLAREGACVVVNDIEPQLAETTAAEIKADGQTATPAAGDVSSKAGVDAVVEAAESAFGRIDVLVNNAGLNNVMRHFVEGDEEWWDTVLTVNLKSVFLCSSRVAPLMIDQGDGCIINLSSGGATKSHRGHAAYDASKGGIEALSRAMALDLAPYGVRVNSLVPGSIDTSNGQLPLETQITRGRTIPLGRMGTPEDLAGAAAFLASDDASYITGTRLVVDGGMLAQQRSPEVDIFPLERYPRIGKLLAGEHDPRTDK